MEPIEQAKRIRLLVMDVDGVLTDGHIYYGAGGEACKAFSARDGLGLTAFHQAGCRTAIITGRTSSIVSGRATELKIGDVCQGVTDKAAAFKQLLGKYKLEPSQAAYVGDDLNDLPALALAGLPCTVADAVPEVRCIAAVVAAHQGGHGGIRDIVEFILRAQDKWDKIVDSYRYNGNKDIIQ